MTTYNVSYGYPSSQLATRAGFAGTGCYALTVEGKITGFADKTAALDAGRATGLEPSRWSIDHPLNAHLSS